MYVWDIHPYCTSDHQQGHLSIDIPDPLFPISHDVISSLRGSDCQANLFLASGKQATYIAQADRQSSDVRSFFFSSSLVDRSVGAVAGNSIESSAAVMFEKQPGSQIQVMPMPQLSEVGKADSTLLMGYC